MCSRFVINIREAHEQNALEVEMVIEKLNRLKSTGTDQIPAELIISVIEQFVLISLNVLILFRIRRKCFRSGGRQSFYLSLRNVIKQNVVIIEAYLFCQLRTHFIQRHALRATQNAEEFVGFH